MLHSAGNIHLTIKNVATSINKAEVYSPKFNALCGSPPSFTLTKNVPIIEVRIPTLAKTSGRRTAPLPANLPANSGKAMKVAPSTIVPIIDPTYDSNKSAPIPATSPTLSPTLSAIVAGFNG